MRHGTPGEGLSRVPAAGPAGAAPDGAPPGDPVPVIDVHTHFFPHTWPDLAERFGSPDWPWMRHDGPATATVMVGDREFRPVDASCWDPAVRLFAMDAAGVDVQVISPTPVLFGYGRDPAHALDCARIFNDAAREIAAGGRGRLVTLAQVPLQDIDAACAEVTRCLRDGHAGVEIGNHVGDRYPDDAGIVTFLQHCAAEGAAVFVHPWDMADPPATRDWMLRWTVGMPTETHLSIARMILGGAFDRLPRTLRICFAHGGGSFAYWLGRMDNAWRRRDLARGVCQEPPSRYTDRFLVDSAVFDHRSLRLLVEVMGDDRVLLGSDYPFPLGEEKPGELVRTSPDLLDAAKARVLGGNAARFLGPVAA